MGGDSASPAAEPADTAPREASDGKRSGSSWVLGVLLAAAIAAAVVQGVRLQALEGQNRALAGELSTARAALDAYANRFAEVRTSVERLQAQFGRLDTLVSADPLEAVPEPPPPATDGAVD
ncbi:MAG: hypothetical protein ACE5FL_14920 [Myxococcota bacterium]